jgi:hypothetical protein
VSLCVYVLRCAVCTPYEKKEQKTVHLKWSICKTKKVYQSLLFNYSLKNRQHMKYCQTININTSSFLSVQAVLKITCRPESDSTMPDISPTFNAKAAFSKLGNILPGERKGVRCDTYERDGYFYAKKKKECTCEETQHHVQNSKFDCTHTSLEHAQVTPSSRLGRAAITSILSQLPKYALEPFPDTQTYTSTHIHKVKVKGKY